MSVMNSTVDPFGIDAPGMGTGTAVLDPDTDTVHDEQLEEGDHERFAHFVRKGQDMQAMIFGTPVTALCGKTWVPTRDPKKFPICPTCKEIWNGMPAGGDSGSDSGQ